MTADIYPFDAAFLSRCATRIINEVKSINRLVHDYVEAARHDRVGVMDPMTVPRSHTG